MKAIFTASGHIERTLCHGAMCAMDEALSQADTGLLLDACAYHDIGRTRDGLDFVHGSTAARFIGLSPAAPAKTC